MSRIQTAQPVRRGPAGLLWPRRRAVAALAMASLGSGILEALFLLVVTRIGFAISEGQQRVDLLFGADASRGASLTVALALVAARIAAAVLATWQAARLSSSVNASIRGNLASAFLRSSWTAQHGSRAGRLQELLTTFAQRGAQLIGSTSAAITSGFSLLALLTSAVLVEPTSSLVVIGAVTLLGLALRPLRAAIRRQARAASATGMDFATGLNEISRLGLEMHVFGVQGQTEVRVRSLIKSNQAMQRRLSFLQGLVPALYTGLAYLALIGALAVVAAVNASDLAAVGAVMLIMLRSLSYGQGLQTSFAAISAALPFLDSLDDELERLKAGEPLTGKRTTTSLGPIDVLHVSFEYDADVPVLRDVTFRLEAQEVVGVVGPSGSGKSTLVQLLLGLRPPTAGEVLASGIDISELKRSQWNRLVTFVPQEAHLIGGTVAENILFLRDDISDADIVEAAKLANLHDDVMGWDEGYDRHVGEQGSHLSGGQKQRLIIARALVENPELLILDEPTSSLDVRSEFLIRQTLDELRSRMTIVIIAHRLSTLEICDRIMVIQDGELRGFDTPARLEETSAFYREALELSGLR